MADDEFVSVRSFWFLEEAQVALMTVRANDVTSYLRDENTVRMVWAWGNCLSGVRLMVPRSEVPKVERLLKPALSGQATAGRPWWWKVAFWVAIGVAPSTTSLQLFYW